jgi:hypothetical protein
MRIVKAGPGSAQGSAGNFDERRSIIAGSASPPRRPERPPLLGKVPISPYARRGREVFGSWKYFSIESARLIARKPLRDDNIMRNGVIPITTQASSHCTIPANGMVQKASATE